MIEEAITSLVVNSKYSELGEEIVTEVKRRVLDAAGVALASLNSPPAGVMKRMREEFDGNAPIIGGGTASPDFSSFYNTLLIRYLDFNDTYLSREPLHPSDMIGPIYSIAKLKKSSVRDLILAIAVGYEIGTRLCDAASLRSLGFDHVNFLGIAASAALSKLLHMDEKKTLNAISIATVPNVALRETRVGELSMWKAGAAADAARNAAFAALAASKGFTAPAKPFSGKYGFANLICRDVLNFDERGIEKMQGILKTHIKKYPVEYHAQSVAEMGIQIANEVRGREIRRIVIETYEAGKSILADDEKWHPKNRETADHSLPFIASASIATGDMWLETYKLIGNRKITELIKKVEVVEREDYTAAYPRKLPTCIIVETDKGTVSREMEIPSGHAMHPLTQEEIEAKFMRLTGKRRLMEKLRELKEVPLIA